MCTYYPVGSVGSLRKCGYAHSGSIRCHYCAFGSVLIYIPEGIQLYLHNLWYGLYNQVGILYSFAESN